VLAGAVATGVYRGWRDSDLRVLEDARQDHAVLFRDLRPGVDVELMAFPAFDNFDAVPRFTARLNQHGVRERAFLTTPDPEVHRIVAVGESSTFGTGLHIGERFTELLQASLDVGHPGCCEVINAGRMGTTTPTAVRYVRDVVLSWRPSAIIYDTMANDIRDTDRDQRLDLDPERVREYEAQLRELVAACDAAGVKLIFWANTIASVAVDDPLARHRMAMRRVASETGHSFLDLDTLYTAAPATQAEMDTFLAEPNWTRWHDVMGPGKVPLSRLALHVDWVHPNRFGSRRLADGLLLEVERVFALSRTPPRPR
jgi:hypothetical protein